MRKLPEVDLRWSLVGESADVVLVAQLRDLGYDDVRVGRLCPQCGSSGHGRPWARSRDVELAVSVARSGEHQLTAAAGAAGAVVALGVDVEVAGQDAWVVREAVGKANGTGLVGTVDPARFDGELLAVEAPPGFVAALAVLRQ